MRNKRPQSHPRAVRRHDTLLRLPGTGCRQAWTYAGAAKWGGLDPAFATCKLGKIQPAAWPGNPDAAIYDTFEAIAAAAR
jgi:hypothetical protein